MLRTPLRRSDWLSDAAAADVFLKIETLQPTFSFKIRGALNAVLRIAEGGAAPPLVTASAGNHGRALACAARAAGLGLTVYVPQHAPRTKLEAIARTGAQLRTCTDYDDAERQAKEHAAAGGALFVSPYSHADVIAGAGTIGLEILDERPDLDAIVVPIGGGGLVSGIAIAAHARAQGRTRVAGAEVEASCPFTRSLAAGRIVEIDVGATLADGLAGNLDPEAITFDIVRRLVDRIVLVSETDLQQAMRGLVSEERLIVEGAGAVAVAAVATRKIDLQGQRVAIVISGGNIDTDTLKGVL